MKDLLLSVHVVAETFNWKFYIVVWQTTSKNCCTKLRAARAARLYFLIYSIKSLFSGVVVAVRLHAVVFA